MYLQEKIVPIKNHTVFAISLLNEHLLHLFADADISNHGYAYIMDSHSMKKKNVLSLCTIATSSGSKETGLVFPIEALVSHAGLVILIFKREYQYTFRLVDLLHDKVLFEKTQDTRLGRYLAINETGTFGLLYTNSNMLTESFQKTQSNLQTIETLVTSITLDDQDTLMEKLSQLEEIVNTSPSHYEPNFRLDVINLKDQTIVTTLEGNPIVHQSASYQDGWLIYYFDNQKNKFILALYNALGKKIKEYLINTTMSARLYVNNLSETCILLLPNNSIIMIDLLNGIQQSIQPHKGLVSKESIIQCAINESGTQIATLTSTGDIAITQLNNEKPITTLFAKIAPFTDLMELNNQYKPTMATGISFLEKTLLSITAGCYQEITNNLSSTSTNSDLEIQLNEIPSQQELKELAIKIGLSRVADKLTEYYSPMILCKSKPNTAKQIGISHFGGDPDLLDNSYWPLWQKRPMQFIGQFNLEDIAKKVPHSDLPKTGLLSLFIGVDPEGMMIYPSEGIKGNEWKILYQKDMTALQTIKKHTFEYLIDFQPIDFETLHRLPQDDSILIEALHLTREEMIAYQNLMTAINQDDDSYIESPSNARNAMLGHPAIFQNNDLELSCELCRQLGSYFEYPQDTSLLEKLNSDAKELRLLFQLLDEEKLELGLGEFYYFFFITKEDLKNENFDRVWLNGQC